MQYFKLQIGCMLIVLYVAFIYIREKYEYKVKQKEHLEEIRQQLIDLCERTRNDRERKEREEKRVPESI